MSSRYQLTFTYVHRALRIAFLNPKLLLFSDFKLRPRISESPAMVASLEHYRKSYFLCVGTGPKTIVILTSATGTCNR